MRHVDGLRNAAGWLALVCVLASGCTSQSKTGAPDVDDEQSQSSTLPADPHGVLESDTTTDSPNATSQRGSSRRDQAIWDPAADLVNDSESILTIDRVRLEPHDGVANIRLAAAKVAPGPFGKVAGTNQPHRAGIKLVPAVGYEIQPASHYSNDEAKGDYPPILYLLTAPGPAPLSYNDTVQVYYHDVSDKKYVAIWFIRYILCVKGETTRHCGAHVPVSS